MSRAPISHEIWDMKYRFKTADDGTPIDRTVEDTWRRICAAAAGAEAEELRAEWATRFYAAVEHFRFIPAGRILASAGTNRRNTLFNCFVMGKIPDDMAGIFNALKEAALTMQLGGGIGYDFSTLRPKGALVVGVGADAAGPLPFMDVWDAMCRTITSAGSRRGAMMGTMLCSHPDIEDFIAVKADAARLRMFNLSVLVTDAFMTAVKQDLPWDLTFGGQVYKTIQARALWDRIMRSTYDYAEPGVIFIDRINTRNNLHYCETIAATNPCGEQPLPPYGACLLGSVNLARLVRDPFTDKAHIDAGELADLVQTAVRFLDNIIDVSQYPLDIHKQEARNKRRMGLGVTGLADAFSMCGIRYGSPQSTALIRDWLGTLRRNAYLASANLAAEKGPFPLYDRAAYLAGEGIKALDEDVREAIAEKGIRNALLTSIAPTGTISLFAENVSSGIEPIFSYVQSRRIRLPDGEDKETTVEDYAYRLYKDMFGEEQPLPDFFVTTQTLTPAEHVAVQSAAQDYIDSSISKTINVPESISFEAFKDVYMRAYDEGCKSCTTYRPNSVTGSILSVVSDEHGRSPQDVFGSASVDPLDRPAALVGRTYKVRWPSSDHAIYITINDVEVDGQLRPFEIFINSKNMEHFDWSVALTRMISAVFRRGGDVTFVGEELKAVFDPRGGQWMNGQYVPSLLAAIGGVIEAHLKAIGFVHDGEDVGLSANSGQTWAPERPGQEDGPANPLARGLTRQCPRCGQPSLTRAEGCDLCGNCSYSKCG